MLPPPSSSNARMVNTTVVDVLIERATVSVRLVFTTSSKATPGLAETFSRMRSKTTIVSWTLNPITVRTPVINMLLISVPNSFPKMENAPRINTASCSAATTAAIP